MNEKPGDESSSSSSSSSSNNNNNNNNINNINKQSNFFKTTFLLPFKSLFSSHESNNNINNINNNNNNNNINNNNINNNTHTTTTTNNTHTTTANNNNTHTTTTTNNNNTHTHTNNNNNNNTDNNIKNNDNDNDNKQSKSLFPDLSVTLVGALIPMGVGAFWVGKQLASKTARKLSVVDIDPHLDVETRNNIIAYRTAARALVSATVLVGTFAVISTLTTMWILNAKTAQQLSDKIYETIHPRVSALFPDENPTSSLDRENEHNPKP